MLSALLLLGVIPGSAPPLQNPLPPGVQAQTPPPGRTVWLDELELDQLQQGWGEAHARSSVDGHALTIGAQPFRRGIGSHAPAEWHLRLQGRAQRFFAMVGVDAEVGERGSVVFLLEGDGRELVRTPLLRGGEGPAPLHAELAGVSELVLRVEDGGDGMDYDHADWGDARLILAPGAPDPTSIAPPPPPDPGISRGVGPETAIHPPFVVGGTPGRPFLFRIPATGDGPLHYQAFALPRGLALDSESGILEGVVPPEGRYTIRILVQGPRGDARSELVLVAGEHHLALTPPMGWNSWNAWGTAVDEAKVRAAADALIASGLAAVGYRYVNIDDAWEGPRDATGAITSNEKFPDMKGLADYLHDRGLLLGIYSSPGPKTCAGYPGSYEHEFQDARTWAEWGVDYLKYDWCSYGKIARDATLPELQKPYLLMRSALDDCGRDIVFSLCQYGMGQVSSWGAEVGGNLWRTTGDITDTWSSLSRIGFQQAELSRWAGPGHWNDPDMLVVGQVGWGPKLHATRLNRNEQVTHISLWALLAAPMLIGCDLQQLDDFTLAVLGNPEVLAIDQDALGRAAHRVRAADGLEVWARPLADGSTAVGLFNRNRERATVRVEWSELGLRGPQAVRDLWRHRDLGVDARGVEREILPHGAELLRLTSRGIVAPD